MDRTVEANLMTKALAGDIEARNSVILGFAKLVYKKALAVKCLTPKDDLYAVGILRILKVFHTFKPELGYRPSTYFASIAYRAMVRYVACEDRLVRFPKTKANFNKALDTFWFIDSLDSVDINGDSLGSKMPARESHTPDVEQYPHALQALKKLSERERTVVMRRQNGETLRGIGEDLKICRERVRQIEEASYRKLRELLREQCNGLGSS